MTSRDVLITGLGVINAGGNDVDQFWRTTITGQSVLQRIDRFDAEGFPVQVAGQVHDFDPLKRIPRRFVAKTDRFTHFALASADEALRDSGVDLEETDRARVGVWYGNNTGGWDLCEQGFDEYYTQGADVVNPWQATAWFLAAPQGFITIRHGVRGPSKSFSGDRSCGATALYYGARSIQWGKNDAIITGGCEAPISPLSLLCFHASGDICEEKDTDQPYRPFHYDAAGLVLGEGAVSLVFESKDHADQRGSNPYGRVLGSAHGTITQHQSSQYADIVRRALQQADLTIPDIDLVFAEGAGTLSSDRMEEEGLREVLGGRDIPVAVPKAQFGHLFGASFGTDVLCACLALRDQRIPAPRSAVPGIGELGLRGFTERGDVRNVLVVSFSRYGTCVAMVVGHPEDTTRRTQPE